MIGDGSVLSVGILDKQGGSDKNVHAEPIGTDTARVVLG